MSEQFRPLVLKCELAGGWDGWGTALMAETGAKRQILTHQDPPKLPWCSHASANLPARLSGEQFLAKGVHMRAN